MRQREALLDLVDLRGERARIGGVALEYLDRHRAAVRRAQQAVDDLQLALLAVAVVAALRQFAAAPLHIARRHVVEHQHAVPQVLAGERRLDRRLALPEPVERDIELVLVDRPQTEDLAKAGSRGERVEHAGGGELGGRRNQPRHDHRDDEVTTTVASRPEQTIESDVAQGAEYGRDMAVRQRAAHHDGLLTGRRDFPALEQRAQAFDDLGRPIGQIGDRALFDFSAVAIALSQQNGGRRVPVRDGFDIHGATMPRISPLSNNNIINYMATFLWPFSQNSAFFNRLSIFHVGSSA